MDGLPADGLQDIKQLRRDVTQAQKTAGQRPAATKASKGWRLGGEAPEADELDPGEVHIRGEDGNLVVRSQDGDTILGAPEFGPGVDDPPDQTSTPLASGATVLGADYNKLGADNAALAATVVELLAVLRSGRFPS